MPNLNFLPHKDIPFSELLGTYRSDNRYLPGCLDSGTQIHINRVANSHSLNPDPGFLESRIPTPDQDSDPDFFMNKTGKFYTENFFLK